VTTLSAALRRSVALPLFLLLVAIEVSQIAFRTHDWLHEWLWAVYQMGFTTVLSAPVAAGMSAWEGGRLNGSRDIIATSPRNHRPLALSAAALVLAAAAAYLVGLISMITAMVAVGTPWGLRPVDLLSVLVPIALLAASVCTGMVVGWYVVRPLLAGAVVAVGWFAVTLWFYASGPAQFVTVGGATDSLFGLMPNVQIQIAQLALYSSSSIFVVALAALRDRVRAVAHVMAVVVLAVACLTTVFRLQQQGGEMLVKRNESTVCRGSEPSLCVGPGYVKLAPHAQAALARYVQVLKRARVEPLPARFQQGVAPGGLTVGPLSRSFLNGRYSEAPNLILSTYISKDCAKSLDGGLADSAYLVQSWLRFRVDGQPMLDMEPLSEFVHSTPEAQAEQVRAAFSTLAECSSSR